MEKMNMNTETLNQLNGVEIKLTTKSINITAIVGFFVLFLAGSIAFIYIWDELSAYNIGYYLSKYLGIGSLKLVGFLCAYMAAYILIQTVPLYWFGGKDKKAFRWNNDWKGIGLRLIHPIALKYYRIILLLPGILLGILPAIHGFCTGNISIFYAGLFGILASLGDINFWYKLRTFDDEDLLLSGEKSFEATIIKRNYGKNN